MRRRRARGRAGRVVGGATGAGGGGGVGGEDALQGRVGPGALGRVEGGGGGVEGRQGRPGRGVEVRAVHEVLPSGRAPAGWAAARETRSRWRRRARRARLRRSRKATGRDAEHGGGLRAGEVVPVGEGESLLVGGGQPGPGGGEVEAPGDEVGVVAAARHVGRERLGQPHGEGVAPALAAAGVEQDLPGDPEDPGPPGVRVGGQVLEPAPHDEEGVRRDVLGVGRVHAPGGEPEHVGVPRRVDRAEPLVRGGPPGAVGVVHTPFLSGGAGSVSSPGRWVARVAAPTTRRKGSPRRRGTARGCPHGRRGGRARTREVSVSRRGRCASRDCVGNRRPRRRGVGARGVGVGGREQGVPPRIASVADALCVGDRRFSADHLSAGLRARRGARTGSGRGG